MSKPVCANCRFFVDETRGVTSDCGGRDTGECRRNAPHIHRLATFLARFPLVHSEFWCGEHRPRDAKI